MVKKSTSTRRPQLEMTAATHNKVGIRKLPTGVLGLDKIMGGVFSFNVISGSPGCGKTTLVHQFVFANATPARPALYFTVLGESAIKMLRYQQQYTFFDLGKLNNRAIRFINLSQVILDGSLTAALEAIIKEVEAAHPSIVVVDSFRSALRNRTTSSQMEVQFFVQQLALHLTSWEATTFLIGEYVDSEVKDNPVFTVADGVVWLYQVKERNSVVRKLQILKVRGQASVPGLHTFRITQDGLQAFSRTLGLDEHRGRPEKRPRLSIGVHHQKVKKLFQDFEKTIDRTTKIKIVTEAVEELGLHATLEEEIFYPAVREEIDDEDGVMNEADEEHHVAKVLLADLKKWTAPKATMTPSSQYWPKMFAIISRRRKRTCSRRLRRRRLTSMPWGRKCWLGRKSC